MTTSEAIQKLTDSLNATNVLSDEYKATVLGWAYKIAEVAFKEGKAHDSQR